MSQDSDSGSQGNPISNKKTEAIYSLRDAAEAKAFAEARADTNPTPAARDALLEAALELEAKTQDAVEACHECGHPHASDAPHYVDNVLPFKNTLICEPGRDLLRQHHDREIEPRRRMRGHHQRKHTAVKRDGFRVRHADEIALFRCGPAGGRSAHWRR